MCALLAVGIEMYVLRQDIGRLAGRLGGGGGGLQYEMPRCVCWGSENAPIMKDALGKKIYPY